MSCSNGSRLVRVENGFGSGLIRIENGNRSIIGCQSLGKSPISIIFVCIYQINTLVDQFTKTPANKQELMHSAK
ncbi:hypothetical protein Hdeb2414_s0001g00008971 [Helianthus debilis subsp. tardiflorus]